MKTIAAIIFVLTIFGAVAINALHSAFAPLMHALGM